jgi:hypothetical protein
MKRKTLIKLLREISSNAAVVAGRLEEHPELSLPKWTNVIVDDMDSLNVSLLDLLDEV